jgi:hypothetical protein
MVQQRMLQPKQNAPEVRTPVLLLLLLQLLLLLLNMPRCAGKTEGQPQRGCCCGSCELRCLLQERQARQLLA